MCQGTINDFWCPCIFHASSHSYYLPIGIHPPEFSFTYIHRPIADPLKTFKSKTSHNIVYSQLSPAYEFCDEYIHTSSFDPRDQLDMGGLCPAGNTISYRRESFISSRLCDSCVMGNCEQNMENVGVKTVKRSRYGWRSREEERERRGRGRRDRSVSPAGSTGSFGTLDRSRSRSVGSNGTAKESDYERLKKGVEPVQDGEETLGQTSLEDLFQAMVETLNESSGVSKSGKGLSVNDIGEKNGVSGNARSKGDVPRHVPAPDVTSEELWMSKLLEDDLSSIPDAEFPMPPPQDELDLRETIEGRALLDEWNSGRIAREYDSDQETVVAGPASAHKKSIGKEKHMAKYEGSKKMEILKRGRSLNGGRKASGAHAGQEPIRRLRFLRRGKSAGRDAGNSAELSRDEEKEITTIEPVVLNTITGTLMWE